MLASLSEAPERTRRMSELAALANGSLSRLSHVVKRLEKRGWIERKACPSDGRYTNAVLTAARLGEGPGQRARARRGGPGADPGRPVRRGARTVRRHGPADPRPPRTRGRPRRLPRLTAIVTSWLS
nr:hypothetical protein GCM10020092_045520 [Actinoplanes digitatis]